MTTTNNERLVSDVKTVLGDAESLLKQAADATGEEAVRLRERGIAFAQQCAIKAHHLQEVVVEMSKAAARAADDYVHEHPWRAISASFGVGLLVGLLLNRSR
mgnify:CR=1 FL=1